MSLTVLTGRVAEVEFELVDFGGTLSGALGGADQRLNRLGNRWRMTVTLARLTAAEADAWAVDLARGLRTGVRMRVPEPGMPSGSPGTVLVAGAGQAGSTLSVDGGTVGHVIRKGKWLSILTGGRRYLHKVAAPLQLGTGGAGTIEIEPLLRVTPADNAVVELAVPIIEGLIEPVPWSIDVRRIAEGVSFTIREAR